MQPCPPEILRLIEKFGGFYQLTPREIDIVVELVKQVTSAEDIARTLNISKNTVRVHLQKLFVKLKVTDKTQVLASLAMFLASELGAFDS